MGEGRRGPPLFDGLLHFPPLKPTFNLAFFDVKALGWIVAAAFQIPPCGTRAEEGLLLMR